MSRVSRVFFAVLFSAFSFGQQKSTAPTPIQRPRSADSPTDSSATSRLPVKRVVLYKNGIGYFEHTARVRGNQDLSIDFTTGQLNDVLKSLTVVDLGQGRIGSVRYNSIAPLDERLRSLRLPFGEQVNSSEFLLALRGARVDVRNGTSSASGRLLSVEKERKQNNKGDYVDITTFAVVTDAGEMRNFELGPATSVRIADRELTDEVGRYLNLVGSSRARDLRRMTISALGAGDREVFVSYISEVPVWKSTYRIILPDKPTDKPLLQGWAIIDNTVGEDWKDVELSLIAGAPQSFIQNISQPYYTRRPTVALPESYVLTPQTHELALSGRNISELTELTPGVSGSGGGVAAGSGGGIGGGTFAANRPGTGGLQGVIKDPSGAPVPGATVTARNEDSGQSQSTTTDARGIYRLYNLPPGNAALFVQATGFQRFDFSNFYLGVGRMNEVNATLQLGTATETIEVQASPVTLNTETAFVAGIASNQRVEAESKDAGDYFEYDLKQKITISKNQSALVPILSSPVEAEKVSIWNEGEKEIRRALWLKNSSGLTVDAGTFNILERDTFAGEGILDTLHPDERRLISYAADPALHIAMEQEGGERPVSHLRIVKGVMTLTREQRETRKYTIRNADKSPRALVIEHPAREAWKLSEQSPKPEETSASFLRFRVSVAPQATEHLQIEETHPEDSAYELSDIDDDKVALLVQNKSLTPDAQQALRRVLDQKNQVEALENQIAARKREIDSITKDQARVRENMKALKGSSEEKALLQRYTRQLDQQEDRLGALQKQIDDVQEKHDKAEEDLDQLIQSIVLDERM
jgi:hypothetical protein